MVGGKLMFGNMEWFCLIPLDLITHCLSDDWQLPHLPQPVLLSFNHPEPKVLDDQGLNGPSYLCLRSQPRLRQQNQYFLQDFFLPLLNSTYFANQTADTIALPTVPPPHRISIFIVCVCKLVGPADHSNPFTSVLTSHSQSWGGPNTVRWSTSFAAARWTEGLSKINFLIPLPQE